MGTAGSERSMQRIVEVSHPAGRVWRPTWSLDSRLMAPSGSTVAWYPNVDLNHVFDVRSVESDPSVGAYGTIAVSGAGIEPASSG